MRSGHRRRRFARLQLRKIMQRPLPQAHGQRGVILIEALMAILIFALGILGLVGVNTMAATAQSDALYRAEANRLATRIVNEMWVNVNRQVDAATLAASLATFAHRADAGAAGDCHTATAGTPSANAIVTAWVSDATGGRILPGSTDRMQQIVVNNNQVVVTVCWKAPSDLFVRKHVVTTYIN